MMEGVFLWFEGETFDQSQLNWVWRGQQFKHPIQGFAGIKPTDDLGVE
jgi:hypothetical protein